MSLLKFFAILFFDIIDQIIHQRKILKFIKEQKTNINLFIDVGSHKGTYTDLIINNFKTKKILMFEPQKNIFNFIKKKYEGIKKVKIFNNVVSNTLKMQTIHINKHDLTSSLTKLNKKNKYLNIKAKLFGGDLNEMTTNSYKIKSLKLRNIIKKNKYKKIDLLKVDTEGHELQVLLGLGKYIKNVDYLLIEFHSDKIYLNYQPKKIHSYLIKNKFVLKKIFKFPFTTWEDRIYLNKDLK